MFAGNHTLSRLMILRAWGPRAPGIAAMMPACSIAYTKLCQSH